jgi:two-component system cell cycle sensor histidine kinase/response regulator CckA
VDGDANDDTFVATSDEIFVLLDREARCCRITIGGAAERSLDFQGWLGRPITECFSDPRSKLSAALERARARGSPLRIEVNIPPNSTPDGKARLFAITIVARACGWALALRDITTTAEARKLAARLEHDEMLDALGILTGSIAHDFNNLLVSISSFAEGASRETTLERTKEPLAAIVSAVNRGKDLTQSLSSFARGGDLSLRSVELVPLLEEVAGTLRALRPDWEITLTTPASGARTLGDAGQIHRALLNVGKNAIEAVVDRTQPARIALSLETRHLTEEDVDLAVPPGAYAFLRIEDQGRGIEEATKARMFEPFFSRKTEGSGLGLFVVQGIARAHGGGVHVTSTPGQCTAFVIALPLLGTPETKSEGGGSFQSSRGERKERTRVLVVDDDPNVGKSLRLLLQGLGHDVVVERSARSALEHFKPSLPSFDLVVTDLTMPGLDGLAFARELRRLGYDLPIVLVSGRDVALQPDALANARIGAVLPKPFTMDELEATVARLVEPSGDHPDRAAGE